MAEKPTETNQPLTPRGALFLYADYSFPLLMFNISLIVICKCQKAAFVSHVFWTNRPLLLLLVFFLYIIVSCLLFLSVEFMDFWCSSTRWIFFNTFKWPNVPKYTLQKSFQSQWCDRKVPLWCHFFKNKMSVFWGQALRDDLLTTKLHRKAQIIRSDLQCGITAALVTLVCTSGERRESYVSGWNVSL